MDEFVIARNPDTESSLPYLVRLPLGERGVVLKVRKNAPHEPDPQPPRFLAVPFLDRVSLMKTLPTSTRLALELTRTEVGLLSPGGALAADMVAG